MNNAPTAAALTARANALAAHPDTLSVASIRNAIRASIQTRSDRMRTSLLHGAMCDIELLEKYPNGPSN